jgi:TPR repeat protein
MLLMAFAPAQAAGPDPTQQQLETLTSMALAGHREAQFYLGGVFANGDSILHDEEKAVMWWRRAAEQGHAQAQNELGAALADGRGVAASQRQAAEWYRKAAEQGLAVAQANLGTMYRDGKGVVRDPYRAVQWYRRAADQGLGWAQYYLGEAYVQGSGVPANYSVAADWYRKAADQDYVEAHIALGALLRRFRVSIEVRNGDYREAYGEYWLARAARNGSEEAIRALVAMLGEDKPETLPDGIAVRAQPDAGAPVIRHTAGREKGRELRRPNAMRGRREWTGVYLPGGYTMGFVSVAELRGN